VGLILNGGKGGVSYA